MLEGDGEEGSRNLLENVLLLWELQSGVSHVTVRGPAPPSLY